LDWQLKEKWLWADMARDLLWIDGFSFKISRNRGGLGVSASGVGFFVSRRCSGGNGSAEIGLFTVVVVDIVRESRWLWVWRNFFMQQSQKARE